MHKSFTSPQTAHNRKPSCLYVNLKLCGVVSCLGRCNRSFCIDTDSHDPYDCDEDFDTTPTTTTTTTTTTISHQINSKPRPRQQEHHKNTHQIKPRPQRKKHIIEDPNVIERPYVSENMTKMFDYYSRQDAFFCSSLVAGLLRYCDVINDTLTRKYQDNEFCPDDLSSDDMLQTCKIRYSGLEHFKGHDIFMISKGSERKYFMVDPSKSSNSRDDGTVHSDNDNDNDNDRLLPLRKFFLNDDCPTVPHWDINS